MAILSIFPLIFSLPRIPSTTPHPRLLVQPSVTQSSNHPICYPSSDQLIIYHPSSSSSGMPPRIGPHTRAEECTAEDYNIPSEERKVLLEQLAEATGEVTLHCWAATHLCSLESLRTLVQIARNSPGVFRTATIDAVNLVKIRKLHGDMHFIRC